MAFLSFPSTEGGPPRFFHGAQHLPEVLGWTQLTQASNAGFLGAAARAERTRASSVRFPLLSPPGFAALVAADETDKPAAARSFVAPGPCSQRLCTLLDSSATRGRKRQGMSGREDRRVRNPRVWFRCPKAQPAPPGRAGSRAARTC